MLAKDNRIRLSRVAHCNSKRRPFHASFFPLAFFMRLSNSVKWAEVRAVWTWSLPASDTSIQFSCNSKWIDATSNSIHILKYNLFIVLAGTLSALLRIVMSSAQAYLLIFDDSQHQDSPIAKAVAQRARSFSSMQKSIAYFRARAPLASMRNSIAYFRALALSSFTWFMAQGFCVTTPAWPTFTAQDTLSLKFK